MTQFYLVRHGQTETNLAHRFNGGGTNTPLTQKGIDGAQKTGYYLRDVRFQAAFSSDQPRALRTAELVREQNTQHPPMITARHDLAEMFLGDWENRTMDEVGDPDQLDAYFHHPDRFDAAKIGAESYAQLIARGTQAFAEIALQYPDGNVLLVAHGIFFLAVTNTLLGLSYAHARDGKVVPNCSVSQLLTSDGQHYTQGFWGLVPGEIERRVKKVDGKNN